MRPKVLVLYETESTGDELIPGVNLGDERRERVNMLAIEARTDPDSLHNLWLEVAGLIAGICRRYNIEEYTGLEFDDLFSCSYFGFLEAVEAYDTSRGSFSTVLQFYIRNSCRNELRRYRKNRHSSLDAPHGEDGDVTLLDLLPDQRAEESYERVLLRSVAKVILDEATRLPNPVQTRIVRECMYWGRSLSQLGGELGVSRQAMSDLQYRAIRYFRMRPTVRAIGKEYFREEYAAKREAAISPYRVKSLSSFKSDFTSIVESIVINRMHIADVGDN